MGLRYHKDAAALRTGLRQAFSSLRSQGFFAKMDHTCCQSCGWAEVPEETENVVFFHRQDSNNIKRRGECYIAHSGDGAKIRSALEAAGLKVDWDGNENTRIKVMVPQSQPPARDWLRV